MADLDGATLQVDVLDLGNGKRPKLRNLTLENTENGNGNYPVIEVWLSGPTDDLRRLAGLDTLYSTARFAIKHFQVGGDVGTITGIAELDYTFIDGDVNGPIHLGDWQADICYYDTHLGDVHITGDLNGYISTKCCTLDRLTIDGDIGPNGGLIMDRDPGAIGVVICNNMHGQIKHWFGDTYNTRGQVHRLEVNGDMTGEIVLFRAEEIAGILEPAGVVINGEMTGTYRMRRRRADDPANVGNLEVPFHVYGDMTHGSLLVFETITDEGELVFHSDVAGEVAIGQRSSSSSNVLEGDMRVKGSVLDTGLITMLGKISINKNLTIEGGMDGRITILNVHDGSINVDQDAGLTGQITIGVDPFGFYPPGFTFHDPWLRGEVAVGTTSPITLDRDQPQPDEAPYYQRTSAELGGGSVGQLPFNYHGTDCDPPHNSTITGVPAEIIVEFYGPLYEGHPETLEMPVRIERTSSNLQPAPPNTPCTTGPYPWIDETANYTYWMHPDGNTRAIKLTRNAVGGGGSGNGNYPTDQT